MQHLAANRRTYASYISPVCSDLPVDGFKVVSTVQFVVQLNTKGFLLLHHLHFFSQDVNRIQLVPVSSEISNQLLVL